MGNDNRKKKNRVVQKAPKQNARAGEGKQIRRARKFKERESKSTEKLLTQKRREAGKSTNSDQKTKEEEEGKIEEPNVYKIPNFWKGPGAELNEDIKLQRKALGIKVQDGVCPPPMEKFNGLPPNFRIPATIKEPSAIQKQAWPTILSGLDMVGIAPTGSGKTLAYVLPMAYHCMHRRNEMPKKGPFALIVLPTRELAVQVHSVCAKSFRGVRDPVRSLALYGGQGKELQLDALSWNTPPQIIAATPGRLIDLLNLQALTLKDVSILVFDEADRMLVLGFEDQLHEIAKHISISKQMLLFSATFALKLRESADKWMKPNRVLIRVSTMELENDDMAQDCNETKTSVTVSSTIRQVVDVCAEHKKPKKLIRFLERLYAQEREAKIRTPGGIVVFCTKIKTVRFVADLLLRHGYKCAPIHSELPQARRELALSNFKAGSVRILVSTDVAARGIHVQHLRYVINYDFPSNISQYCHRIGRTGRQGADGYAYSFFTRKFAALAKSLIALLESTNQRVDPNLTQLALETNLDMNDMHQASDESEAEEERGDKDDEELEESAPSEEDEHEHESFKDIISEEESSDVDEEVIQSLAPNRGKNKKLGGVEIKVPVNRAQSSDDEDEDEHMSGEHMNQEDRGKENVEEIERRVGCNRRRSRVDESPTACSPAQVRAKRREPREEGLHVKVKKKKKKGQVRTRGQRGGKKHKKSS